MRRTAGKKMSWSNCESSAPGFRGASGRRRGTEARSPVPYRQNPMAYEPEVLCHCNPRRKAPRWISWSRANPGRRYYSCVNAMVRSLSLSDCFCFLSQIFFLICTLLSVIDFLHRMEMDVGLFSGMILHCPSFLVT